MATVATQIVPQLVTVTATNVALIRGVRVTLNSSGLVAVTSAATRGDYITTQAIAADGRGLAAPIAAGGSIPVNFSGTANVGDLIYSAASGQVSTTSTNAVLMGRAKQAATNANLSVIELESVA